MFTFNLDRSREEAIGLLARTPHSSQSVRPFLLGKNHQYESVSQSAPQESSQASIERGSPLFVWLLMFCAALVGGGLAAWFIATYSHSAETKPHTPTLPLKTPRKRPVLAMNQPNTNSKRILNKTFILPRSMPPPPPPRLPPPPLPPPPLPPPPLSPRPPPPPPPPSPRPWPLSPPPPPPPSPRPPSPTNPKKPHTQKWKARAEHGSGTIVTLES